jgi:hypothetical protein
MKYGKYSTSRYPFSSAVEEMLEVSSLRNIHKNKGAAWDLIVRETDQGTPYHRLYYREFENKLRSLWEKFVIECLGPLYDEDILYQSIPTFRIQIPGNLAVGEFHRDSQYGHQDGTLNIFLPFVDVIPANTIYVESEKGKKDFSPLLLTYGEFAVWDGVNLEHGNIVNTSTQTRVSIDARVIPFSKFNPTERTSINTKARFEEGDYYKRLVL